jgi:hypothetical protein
VISNPEEIGPPAMRAQIRMAKKIVLDATFRDRFEDRDLAISVFEEHNSDVQSSLPPERLLVFEASQGWEPLCRFLGVPVPEEPYPRVNSTEDFRAMRGRIAAETKSEPS